MNIFFQALRSKTVLLALAQAVAGIVVVFQASFPELGWIAIAKSLIDVYVRSITTTSLGSK